MNETQFAKALLDTIPPLIRLIRTEVRGAAVNFLSVPQFRVLANIKNGLNTVSQIAEHQGISQPAMTKLVNGLVKKNLVLKKKSMIDGRETFLFLTPKGKKLHKTTWSKAQDSIKIRLENINIQNRVLIIKALSILRAELV